MVCPLYGSRIWSLSSATSDKPNLVRVPSWWVRCEPVAVQTTRETAFGYRVEDLQAGHAYVSGLLIWRADSYTGYAQQQSGCGWGGLVLCGQICDRKDLKIHVRRGLQRGLPVLLFRASPARTYVNLESRRGETSPSLFRNHAIAGLSLPPPINPPRQSHSIVGCQGSEGS